jgi:hypothetical protein
MRLMSAGPTTYKAANSSLRRWWKDGVLDGELAFVFSACSLASSRTCTICCPVMGQLYSLSEMFEQLAVFGAQLACCGLVRNTRPGEASCAQKPQHLCTHAHTCRRDENAGSRLCFIHTPNADAERATSTCLDMRPRGSCRGSLFTNQRAEGMNADGNPEVPRCELLFRSHACKDAFSTESGKQRDFRSGAVQGPGD